MSELNSYSVNEDYMKKEIVHSTKAGKLRFNNVKIEIDLNTNLKKGKTSKQNIHSASEYIVLEQIIHTNYN